MNFIDLIPDVKSVIFSEVTRPCYNKYFINDSENKFSQIIKISLVCKEWYTIAAENYIWEPVFERLLNVCKLHDHLNHLTNFNSLTHSRDKIKLLMKNLIEIKNFYINANVLFFSPVDYRNYGLEWKDVNKDCRRRFSALVLADDDTNDSDTNDFLLQNLIENEKFELAEKLLSLKPNLRKE